MSLVRVCALTFHWHARDRPALRDVSLVLEGGLTVVAGPSGHGKSTLLRLMNGLIPHFHGGRIRGRAWSCGWDVLHTPPRLLAASVGTVFQDPETQLIGTSVEREVAFGPANAGVPRRELADRVDEALDLVGMAAKRTVSSTRLSGGEQQRVVVAAALAGRPRLLVLDEPLAQLDATGADAVAAICRRAATTGVAVVVAEHRLDDVLPCADRLVRIEAGRIVGLGSPSLVVRGLSTAPQVARLGEHLELSDPLPLSERELPPAEVVTARRGPQEWPVRGPEAWSLRDVVAGAGDVEIDIPWLAGVSGEVVLLVGPNGGGKTTVLRTIAGLLPVRRGRVWRRPGSTAYLPQAPTILLHQPTVDAEVRWTLRHRGDPVDSDILADLGLGAVADRNPRDLSAGERQRVAIAAVACGRPALVLLDEPTRGMDGDARDTLTALVRHLRHRGSSIVIATHDLELAAEVADTVVEVADGAVRMLGSAALALGGGTEYSTPVGRWSSGAALTVREVAAWR